MFVLLRMRVEQFSVIGDRATFPTWVKSQLMTLILRINHLGGIAQGGQSKWSHNR